jgi:hypothetical protein
MRNNIKTLVLSIALFIYSMTAFCANSSGEENFITMADPSDPGSDPGAPIGDFIIPMLIFGIALSFYLLKKRKTA